MKYIDADLLRKEIEKNKNMIDGLFTKGDDSVYDGENDAYNRVLCIIDSLYQEPDKNLEEAAEISFDEAYTLTEDYRDFLAKGLTENKSRPIGPHWFCEYAKNRFIAGANWQKEKDIRDMVMSDNRQFQKAYELGKKDMMEKMMKEKINEIIEYINGKEEFNQREII